MTTQNMLFKTEVPVNEHISIVVPTLGQILDNEDEYYSMVSMITSTPFEYMVQLDDLGIDFTKINEYDLFLLMFSALRAMDTSLIFGDLDLSKFSISVNEEAKMAVLKDEEHGIVIDRLIHAQIAATLRKIHGLEKERRKPANEDAKQFLLERARAKQKRHKNRKQDSQLEVLIVSLVNTPEFKYTYETVGDLTIYQFNRSVRQVISRVDFDKTMIGVYAGTVDTKKLSQDRLTWIAQK